MLGLEPVGVADRVEAGLRSVERLGRLRPERPVVEALPRGVASRRVRQTVLGYSSPR